MTLRISKEDSSLTCSVSWRGRPFEPQRRRPGGVMLWDMSSSNRPDSIHGLLKPHTFELLSNQEHPHPPLQPRAVRCGAAAGCGAGQFRGAGPRRPLPMLHGDTTHHPDPPYLVIAALQGLPTLTQLEDAVKALDSISHALCVTSNSIVTVNVDRHRIAVSVVLSIASNTARLRLVFLCSDQHSIPRGGLASSRPYRS